MVYKFSDEKSKGRAAANNEIKQKLHKSIIIKFKKREIYSGFNNNICGADLADMHLLSKLNKGFRFLLYVIDIFSKIKKVLVLLMLFKKY